MGRTKISRGSFYFFHIAWISLFFPSCLVPTIFSILPGSNNFFHLEKLFFQRFSKHFSTVLENVQEACRGFFQLFWVRKNSFSEFSENSFQQWSGRWKGRCGAMRQTLFTFWIEQEFFFTVFWTFFQQSFRMCKSLAEAFPSFFWVQKEFFPDFSENFFNSDADVEKDVAQPCDRLVHFLNFEKNFSLKVSKNFFYSLVAKEFWQTIFL